MRPVVSWLRAGIACVSLTACAELGPSPPASLPADAHARPGAAERAAHPCRYGDVAACLARCDGRDPQACNAAGVLLEFDGGERSDPTLASGYYRRACDGNYGPGCNNLAWLYLRGSGVQRDPPQAMVLFMAAFDAARLACARGDASGCLLAGELLYQGRGVPADDEAATAFFEQAARR
jgi:TPR repeat protein